MKITSNFFRNLFSSNLIREWRSANAYLNTNGTVSLTLLHPCFNSGFMQIRLPEDFKENDCGVLRKSYATAVTIVKKGKPLQPVPHPNFHRSLSCILENFFSAGFVLDQCIEPTVDSTDQPFLWLFLPDIPPIMVLRFRRNCSGYESANAD